MKADRSDVVQRSPLEKIFMLGVGMLFAVVVTFGIPKNVFLLSFYIIPIILAANYYGLVGGIGCAAFSTVLAVGLANYEGVLMKDAQVIAQIILYFLVGGFGGLLHRENVRIRNALQIASIVDELTGMYNYRHFRQRLDEEVKRAAHYGRYLALVLCDIDGFKRYNDTFGHPSGNFALNKVATLIGDSIWESDIACRYGGDEFAIILPERGSFAEEDARRIITAVNDVFASEEIDADHQLQLSAGVAYINPLNPLSSSQLIFMADKSLYEAKRSGKKVVLLP